MPGPAPLDRPAFPDEFLDNCRSLVRRRTVPHSERQRARLVLLLHESPDLSNVAAGALVELHSNSVHRWRQRWARGNFFLADQAGRGRKPPFLPRDRAIVKAIACEAVCQTKLPLSRLSTADLADRASTDLGRSISPSTVWRILDTDAIKPWRYQYLDLSAGPEVLRKS
jgi:transposase